MYVVVSYARRALAPIVVLAALCALALPSLAQAASPDVKVMTRNLYLGSSLDPATSAGTNGGLFIQGVAQIYGTVQFTDFKTRADALAGEIAAAKPDLVGLQEVSIWTVSPITGLATPTPPSFEFLDILQTALSDRNLNYEVVATADNANIGPAPLLTGTGSLPDCGFFSFPEPLIPDCVVRLQDRDVILVNNDRVGLTTSEPESGRYTAQATVPTPVGELSFARGWASIDASLGGKTFRFFNTHLEVEGETAPIQEAQGVEALAIIKDPSRTQPVIAVGDFNSAANNSTTKTYKNLKQGGLKDVWSAANGNAGYSCCENQSLTNPASQASQRIDLVLTYGNFAAKAASLVGNSPFRSQTPLAPRPIWASDHFGVVGTVKQG